MDMQRYNVRSNCIGPHAFSRMIETVPGQTEAQLQARAAKTRPDHIAQLIAFLGTDAAAGVSGQIFGVRGNEIYLYNQPRPIRIMARPERLDAGEAGGTLAARGEEQFHPAGADPGRVSRGTRCEYGSAEASFSPRHGGRRAAIHALRCWLRRRRGWCAFAHHDEAGRRCA